MSLMKKNKPPENLDTLIGSKTIFEGVLMSNESICIEGTVKGKVECKGTVVIGQEAKIKADIVAENVIIGGQVNGNISTKNKLEITTTGKVKGDIETSRLVIAEGVVFEGSCRMNGARSESHSSSADKKSMFKNDPEKEKKLLQISTG